MTELEVGAITDQDPLLQEFGMGGLANICLGEFFLFDKHSLYTKR